jgi:hypothetical protein
MLWRGLCISGLSVLLIMGCSNRDQEQAVQSHTTLLNATKTPPSPKHVVMRAYLDYSQRPHTQFLNVDTSVRKWFAHQKGIVARNNVPIPALSLRKAKSFKIVYPTNAMTATSGTEGCYIKTVAFDIDDTGFLSFRLNGESEQTVNESQACADFFDDVEQHGIKISLFDIPYQSGSAVLPEMKIEILVKGQRDDR